MERISAPSSLPNAWEYVKKLDEKAKIGAATAGTLGERIGLSTKYRTQSQAIQHGTKVILNGRWDSAVAQNSLSKFEKLNGLAKLATSGANAVTYEGLVQHIRAGNAINTFNWKGLIKSRGWHHVDHATCITQGTAGAIGKFVALNLAKAFIIYDAVKDAKTTFENEKKKGTNSVFSAFKAGFTAVKELAKSLVSWEMGALGAAVATVCFPGFGFLGMMAGGILFGGVAGFLLEKYAPSPVKQTVPVGNDQNPFV
ncbi:MAG: hypothetical protein AB1782_20510 [Cyanobacteriota bacterium]